MTETIHNTKRLIPDAALTTYVHLSEKLAQVLYSTGASIEPYFPHREDKAMLTIGLVESLVQSILTMAQVRQVSVQSIIDALIQENEQNFGNGSFGVSEAERSNGRVAIRELVDAMNGMSSTSEQVNIYTPQAGVTMRERIDAMTTRGALLDVLLAGLIRLKRESFREDADQMEEAGEIRSTGDARRDRKEAEAHLLAQILADAVVNYVALFEEFDISRRDVLFTGEGSLLYSRYIGLAVVLTYVLQFSQSLANAEQDGSPDEHNRMNITAPLTVPNLAYGLKAVILDLLADKGENYLDYSVKRLREAQADAALHVDFDKVERGADRLHTEVSEMTGEDVEGLVALAAHLFMYDTGTEQTVFQNDLLTSPMAVVLQRVAEVGLSFPKPGLEEGIEENAEKQV